MEDQEYSRERQSKAMFGTKDALDIYGVIGGFEAEPPRVFTVAEVHQQFLDPRSVDVGSIRKHIAKLELLGEIQRVPSEDPAYKYRRIDSVFWERIIKPMVDQSIDMSLGSQS